jgi:hypothetical protein
MKSEGSRSHRRRRNFQMNENVNRQKRTRDSARWILMSLGRLATSSSRSEISSAGPDNTDNQPAFAASERAGKNQEGE